MPVVPISVDSSTVAVTSVITAAITYHFCKRVVRLEPFVALVVAATVGFILYSYGLIPIGLLFVAGFAMVVAIFKFASGSSETKSQINSQPPLPPPHLAKIGDGATIVAENEAGRMADLLEKRQANNIPSVFRLLDGSPMTPYAFGVNAVKLSMDNSHESSMNMAASNDPAIQQKLSSQTAVIQLHLIALQTATFVVCGNRLSRYKEDVVNEIAEGIVNGFTALFKDEDGKIIGADNPRSLYELFRVYVGSLNEELDEIVRELEEKKTNLSGENFSNVTSALLVNNLGVQCGIGRLLLLNSVEKLRLEQIVSRVGIALLLRLIIHKHLTYSA